MLTELFITSRSDWRNDAACRDGIDPEAFFPVANPTFDANGKHHKTFVAQAQRALAMCRGCPVKRDCLQVAINDPRPDKDLHAVVGGSLPGQRAMYRKALAAVREAEKVRADEAAEADQPAFAA